MERARQSGGEISVRELLRLPDVLSFLASRFFSGMALTLMRATVAWHVFALTSSAFHLGMIGVCQFVPTLGLSLVAGAIADSYRRRTVVMLSQVLALVASATLAAVTFLGLDSVGILYAIVVANSVAASFDGPARQAILPALVPRAHFPKAVSLHSTVQNIAWVSGPVVAGLVIADFGVASAYGLRVAMLASSMLCIAQLRAGDAPRQGRAVGWPAIREGLEFVRRRPAVWGAMSLDMFAVIFAGATALLPIYASEILHVGARGYGLLSAAFETGALLMAVWMFMRPPMQRVGRALLLSIVFYGLATIVFGLSRWFPLSLAAFVVAGMADQVSVVARSVIVQMSTPDELRGRVSSVNLVFIGASNQLGAAESGFVAALTSATFAVVSGGVLALVVAGMVAWRLPELRRYRL